MKKTNCIRVEASILLFYVDPVDSLPTSLPSAYEIEEAMSKAVLAAYKKAKKKPPLDAIGSGRFHYSLVHKRTR